jgi:hypothetical protein
LGSGDPQEAVFIGGSMAQILEGLGRHEEAQRAWARFVPTPTQG